VIIVSDNVSTNDNGLAVYLVVGVMMKSNPRKCVTIDCAPDRQQDGSAEPAVTK